jgi:hypothetical protein
LESIVPLAKHRYGSHVLQAIISKVGLALRLGSGTTEDDAEQETEPLATSSLPEAFLRISEALLADFSSLMTDTYGAHVLAATTLALAGRHNSFRHSSVDPWQDCPLRRRHAPRPARRTETPRGRSTRPSTTAQQLRPQPLMCPQHSQGCYRGSPMRCWAWYLVYLCDGVWVTSSR